MAALRHRFVPLAASALVCAAAIPTAAQADWRYGHRYRGGDVALGILGGVAAGALIGGALAAPPPPAYYAPPPPPRAYYPAPAYVYERGPACYWTRQKVWLDSWTYQIRRVQVCD